MADSLGQPGVAAVKWSAASAAARFSLQLVAQIVLARTLGPEVFGIFAIGMVVLTFATFVSSFGFSWSLMQRTQLNDDDIRFAWTWQLIVGLLTTFAVYMSAPFLAQYFREPRAEAVIEWLSLACLLTAAASPANYLLQRDLNFRAVGLIQVGSYAAGYVLVGLPMAVLGWGASSLVAAWLVQAAVMLIASYAAKRHALRPLFWYPGARLAVGTGRAVFMTNVVNWLLNNIDRVLIGRILNAHALGLYNVAYNLAAMPNTLLLGALQPAFLAAGARLQNDHYRLGKAYFQMIATILVLAVPVFVTFAVMADDLVNFLYGPQWRQAGWVLAVLFLSMPAYVVWGLSTPVLWNTGRKNHEFALQLPLVLLGAAGFYAFADQGIRTAAVIAALLLVLRSLVIGIAALRALELRLTSLMPHVLRGLLLSAICAAGAVVGQRLSAGLDMPLLSLVASGLTVVVTAGTLVALFPRLLGEQTADMVLRFVPRLSSWLKDTRSSPLPDTPAERHTRGELPV